MSTNPYLANLALGAIRTREQFAAEAADRGNTAMASNDLHVAYSAYQEVARHEQRIVELQKEMKQNL
jgi:hypothetical protein